MPHEIFVSLTQQDSAIAEALKAALEEHLFGKDIVNVVFSTSKELGGGILHGQDWFEWIVEKVQKCDFAFILFTPSSAYKPWILWEAGAVHGAAVAAAHADAASGRNMLRKVRPLLFQLDPSQLPSPIRESKVQCRRGDVGADVAALFTELYDQFRDDLSTDRTRRIFQKIDGVVADYLLEVDKSLLRAPAMPTPEVIEEWRIRLDDVLSRDRASEVEHLHDWLEIAFGRERDEHPRPLDLRIHSRLAEMYLKSRKYSRAIQQLELARQLTPRDIYVLRRLGKAYLDRNDSGDRSQAKAVVDRILELDGQALVHNAECAALAARWYREGGNRERAASILQAALDADPESYYLANVLGEVLLEAGDEQAARKAFERALSAAERLRETNTWTCATAANANFVLGDDDVAASYLRTIAVSEPGTGELATVEKGLLHIAQYVENGQQRVLLLVRALRS